METLVYLETAVLQHGCIHGKARSPSRLPIAVAERSEARTVFACSNTAIVGSNSTQA
jgi:hypothetical protein